ncbi:MAG: trigger factor [Clostridiales bacterium]|jgi:trigger factor|nr:trigger factor [Clostridiales bacterium]
MATVEMLEENRVKLMFEVGPERFEKALERSYRKNKNKIRVQGFRPGKAPRKMMEMEYGSDLFFSDAVDDVLQSAYQEAIEQNKLEVIGKPEINVESVSKESGVVFAAACDVVGEVSVDGYYALTYDCIDTEPSEEELQALISRDREKNARVTTVSRPIQNGDVVLIDFDGRMDGRPFEGGRGKDYELTIGSNTFIGAFENQLLEAKTGDHLTVYITFPEDYMEQAVAGKPAAFDVDIKEVREKELPEADDDFAQDISDFETFQEYRDDLADKIRQAKQREAEQKKEEQIIAQLIEKTTANPPPILVQEQLDENLRALQQRIEEQGWNLDQFCQYISKTQKELLEEYRNNAYLQVKGTLALEAVAKKENITITPEEIEADMNVMKAMLRVDSSVTLDPDYFKKNLLIRKAMRFIKDKAVEVNR